MIELQNITHAYAEKRVLENLNLVFKANHLTCLLGGSGCGKTTILRLIAGLEVPQNGKVIIQDRCVTKEKEILILPHQRDLGFVFQDLALWPHFTIFDNIAFGLKEHKAKNIKEIVMDILDFFGIEKEAQKFPHQLSGGQKQLVAIARALVLRPKILLMDEPLSNLDVKLKRKILNRIKDLKKEFDLTIIYVTHDHKEAFAIADEIVVLDEGHVAAIGTVPQIRASTNSFVRYFLDGVLG